MVGLIAAVLAMSVQAQDTELDWVEALSHPALESVEVRAIEATTNGDIWFAVRDRGLARLRGDSLAWIGTDDGLVSTGIADIHEDARGRLWAVGLGGYSVLEGDAWRTSSVIGDLRPRVVFSAQEEPRGDAIWLGSSEGAGRFVAGDHGAQTVISEADGLPHQVVHAVAVDEHGDVWLACRRGLARLSGDEISVAFPNLNFRGIQVGPEGTLWFGTSDGLFEWDGDSWTRHLEGGTVIPMLVAADGAIWAGSPEGRLYRRENAGWRTVQLPARLRGAEVFDVEAGPDGRIWIGTSAGAASLSFRAPRRRTETGSGR